MIFLIRRLLSGKTLLVPWDPLFSMFSPLFFIFCINVVFLSCLLIFCNLLPFFPIHGLEFRFSPFSILKIPVRLRIRPSGRGFTGSRKACPGQAGYFAD